MAYKLLSKKKVLFGKNMAPTNQTITSNLQFAKYNNFYSNNKVRGANLKFGNMTSTFTFLTKPKSSFPFQEKYKNMISGDKFYPKKYRKTNIRIKQSKM